MQRLYLAPHRFDSLPAFLDADPRALRVGVVPTAMGVLEDRAALQEDLGALDAMGFAVEQIELQGMRSRELADRLGRSDLVFVSGGNPYHLLPAASPRTRWKAPELTTTTAMGLVPFTVMPHHNDPARQARHRAVLEQDAGRGRVVALADDQAIEVR